MACFHPIEAYKTNGGSIVFRDPGPALHSLLKLPCGRCIGCRLERSRQWSLRCINEASLYKDNAFVTLTYDDAHLPPGRSLQYRDFQLFLKRLRKYYGTNVRFYMCGEYGTQTQRPHYHACLFNLSISDKKLHSRSGDDYLYSSLTLSKLWPYGHSLIGDVTSKSAAYCARYMMDKLKWDDKTNAAYANTDPDTGEVTYRTPEFSRMSLRPGIGAPWVAKFGSDVFNHDKHVYEGKPSKPPRYYDILHKRTDPSSWAETKGRREDALVYSEEHGHRRLKDKEELQGIRIKQLTRDKLA